MFRSLRLHNYRAWFFGALISFIGQWMQSTAQSWVVLTELTDGDAAAMGVTMALQFAPPLVLVGVTGWVADRFDRRAIVAITQSALLVSATAIGILLLTGVMTLSLMYVFALVLGLVQAFDTPARQAIVTDIVGREHAQNAVALNSASFNMARLIGPAAAGVLIVTIGSGWVFLINAATYIAMLVAIAVMRQAELQPRVRMTRASRLADGFRYVGRRPDLIVLFVVMFLIGAFGMNFPIYASTMALEFGHDADGFGVLTSMFAIGALVIARRGQARLRIVAAGCLLFGAASLVSAFMPAYWAYAAVIVVIGLGLVMALSTANAYVQTTTEPTVRGRVLALYLAVLMGGTPVGAPIVGWVAAVAGPRVAILVGASAGIVAFGIGLAWFLASGRVRRSADARLGVEVTATRPLDLVVVPEEFSDAVVQATPIREQPEDELPEEPADERPPRGSARG